MKHLPTRTKHFSPFGGDAEGRGGLKKTLLLLTFAFCLSTFAFSQNTGWVDISANLPDTLNYDLWGLSDVFFISDDEGWIPVSSDAIILHTTDGGETFEIQTTLYSCNAIHMLNETTGYAGGKSGFIYKTTDGGEHWIFYGTMATTLADISFPPTGNTGYCCGINGNIWSIDSSGVTKMTSGVPDNLSSLSFPGNSEEGWVCGGSIIRHFINNEWTAADQDYPSGGYNVIYMVDNNNGWIVGDDGIIAHTTDGKNWFEQANPDPSQNSFFGLFFLNENNGWAVGSGGTILHTNNGGENWIVVGQGITSNFLVGVHFTSSPNNGYVVGNDIVLKYTGTTTEENNDATLSSIQINSEALAGFNTATLNYQLELPAGTTIAPTVAATPTDANATVVVTQAATLPGTATVVVTAEDGTTQQTYTVEFTVAQNTGWVDISANIPTEANLSDVFFVSDNEGWITSSSHAEIYHTTDGGETFEVQTTQYSCNAIYMIDKNEGYAGGANGRVYRTTDGGKNWIAIGSISATLADISFPPNGNTGYCCGINGNIWSIDSSGVTKMTSGVPDNLYSLSFPGNSEEGWVCGGSIIRHFINNEWTAADQDYPSGGYNAIFMVDSLNGWVVGDAGIIAHTTDGQNWFEQANPDPQLNTFYNTYFFNTSEGWAVGLSGTLIHTINGGDNWNMEAVNFTSKQLNAVHFTSPTNGYVVGNGKTLLKYGELTSTGNTIVKTPQLSVFPNPATSELKVQSSKFKVESATVAVFSITGKKCLSKYIPAGCSEVEIEISSLNSGIYFCKIQFSNKCVTKKIVVKQ